MDKKSLQMDDHSERRRIRWFERKNDGVGLKDECIQENYKYLLWNINNIYV